MFGNSFNHYGLSRFISLWFITRKFVAGRPWLFSFTFLASIFILGALTSASPAALIGWSILYGVCEVCGYKKGDSYPTMMVFGIVFAAQIGQSMIPFKQVALTVFSAYETMSGMGIDYAKYMLIACLICLLCALFFIVLGKYIFRPDMSKLLNLEADKLDTDGSLNLTGVQKTVLLFLFLLVTVMAAIKVEGKPLLNFKVMVDSGVTWGIVLLAFVQPLTIAMAAPGSGITDFLMQLLTPFFGESSSITFALFIGFAAVALTQVMNNGAVGVVLMPVIHSFCQASGMAPELPLIMVVMGVHFAFLTPAASASAALLHGNEWCNTKAIWKSSPLAILGAYAATAIVTLRLGSLLYS